jgi:hypothetical protein
MNKLAKNDQHKNRTPGKILFFSAVALFHIALFAYLTHARFTLITHIKNGEFYIGSYRFEEENPSHPRLLLLRKRENLDRVIAPGKTQLEKIVLLRKWAHSQWSGYTGKFYYPPWDALEILDLARNHGNCGFCAQYAIVFLQACQSMGLHARYVDLPGHFTVAVWSDDFDRWVIMDPTSDIHYERNGVPLRGRELCDAYWNDKWHDIYKVGSSGERTKIAKKEDIASYRMYSIMLRNDHLTKPELIKRNGRLEKLALLNDYRGYPFVSRDNVSVEVESLAFDQPGEKEKFSERMATTNDPDDLRYVFNQTVISADRHESHPGIMKIKLIKENSPEFKTFLVNIDNTGWRPSSEDVVGWTLHAGFNKISARVLTTYGWQGEESTLTLFYKPSWIF